jgi:HPt (histidine-containing phosphotransfer) domain-containing protein
MEDLNGAEELLDIDLIHSMREALGWRDRHALFIQWRLEIEGYAATLADLEGDAEGAAACAHRLKGAAASFGAKRLAALAGDLETRPGADLLPDIKAAVAVSIPALELAMLSDEDK